MGYQRILSLVFCFLLIISVLFVDSSAQEVETDPAIINGCHSVDAGISFLGQAQLAENIQSAFVFETNSQTLMYAWNADAQMYPASLVKIMTALLVLENGNLADVVTVTQSALDSVSADAIAIDLQAGEQLTVEQLLYCLMVYSANDAAAVLAEHISGSQTAFVDLMNVRAAELGCTGTTYTNPHGLHNDLQVTTARDVCRVLQQALKFDAFRAAFGSEYYTVEATNLSDQRNLTTNNYLMNTDTVTIHYDSRVTGGRCGETADGYRCVATTSQQGNMELICVVMGAKTTYLDDGYSIVSYGGFPETSQLLDYGFTGYSRQQVIFRNQILRQQTVINGDCDVFVASMEDFYTVLPDGYNASQLTFRYTDVPGSGQAPVSKGQKMSVVQVWYGNMCIAKTDLFAMNDVPVAHVKTVNIGTDNAGGNLWGTALIIVICAAVVFVAVIMIRMFAIRSARRSNRSKKRRRQ